MEGGKKGKESRETLALNVLTGLHQLGLRLLDMLMYTAMNCDYSLNCEHRMNHIDLESSRDSLNSQTGV